MKSRLLAALLLTLPILGCDAAPADPDAPALTEAAGPGPEAAGPASVSIADQPANTWVKRSPLPEGPPSPRLGYESSMDWDPAAKRFIRWGAHDPGGGGPQLTETWTFNPVTCEWNFLRTNNNPPGNCCCRENVFDPVRGVFTRFSYPAFGHGWYWDRSRYLREDSVWRFDLGKQQWTNMRPGSEPALNVGKGGVWDPNREVIWIYDTKLRLYHPHTNTWHSVNQSEQIGKRSYGGMALDWREDKIVLFGNQGGSDERTWVYDIKADKWTDARPATHPPGVQTSPTLVYDSRARKIVAIMLAKSWRDKETQAAGLQTWTYDVATNKWERMNPPAEPDWSSSRSRLMRYIPEWNIIALENRTKNEQQMWTYRLTDKPAEQASVETPQNVQAVSRADGSIAVSWEPVGGNDNRAGYRVVRDEGKEPWKTDWQPMNTKALDEASFVDTTAERGKVYRYRVLSVADDGTAGEWSRIAHARPALIVDARVDVLGENKVAFSWQPSDEGDVVGYVVDRAVMVPISAAQTLPTAGQYKNVPQGTMTAMAEKRGLGQWQRLTPTPITATSFTDDVDLTKKVEVKDFSWQPWFGAAPESGKNKKYDMTKPGCPYTIYAYRVRAVNRHGVEGGPSPYQLTIANEAPNLYSKEVGTDLHLKWDASPHRDIRGYLVYRLNGRGTRWDRDSAVELRTPEPIRATEFVDTDIADKHRRYYVVVVDKLGQQGLPSHGVWSWRPWRTHYAPWVPEDGWHQ